jgi:RimJ/RimL family protein N-acetyltransferase
MHLPYDPTPWISHSGREVTFREALPADAQALLDFVQVMSPELNIGKGEFWVKSTEEEEKEISLFRECENSIFLVACSPDREIIATLTLASRDLRLGQGREAEKHVAHVGLSVSKSFRHEGIGSELLKEALRWAFKGGVLKRVEISSYSTNTKGRALYKSLGFKEEGIKRRAIRRGEEWVDIHMLALLLDEEEAAWIVRG